MELFMSYKEFTLRSKSPEDASTEIMYEIASSRADGVDLIRINVAYSLSDSENADYKKSMKSIIRLLKSMKQKGSIQFFATADSFRLGTTEAIFLQNKYPSLLPHGIEEDSFTFIFVKI